MEELKTFTVLSFLSAFISAFRKHGKDKHKRIHNTACGETSDSVHKNKQMLHYKSSLIKNKTLISFKLYQTEIIRICLFGTN